MLSDCSELYVYDLITASSHFAAREGYKFDGHIILLITDPQTIFIFLIII